jgi:hypothetical protein
MYFGKTPAEYSLKCLAHITMSQDQISTIFTALGKADWMSRIAIGLSGAELDTTLRANG